MRASYSVCAVKGKVFREPQSKSSTGGRCVDSEGISETGVRAGLGVDDLPYVTWMKKDREWFFVIDLENLES